MGNIDSALGKGLIKILGDRIESRDIDVPQPTIVSEEEARRNLQLPTSLPPHFGRILGEQNIGRLLDILGDPDNLDLDVLPQTEPMGLDAARQYFASLREFQDFRCQIRELALVFVRSLIQGGRLNHYFNKSFVTKPVMRDGVPLRSWGISRESGIVELFRLLPELRNLLLPNCLSFRHGMLAEMVIVFQKALYLEALKAFESYIELRFRHENAGFRETLRKNFIQTIEGISYRNALSIEGARQTTPSAVQVTNLVSEQAAAFKRAGAAEIRRWGESCTDLPALKRENDEKAAEVDLLSQTRLVEFAFEIRDGRVLCIIPIPKARYHSQVCVGYLAIEEGDSDDPKAIPFVLDRSDMAFHVNQGITRLSDLLPPEAFEVVRKDLFDLILKQLRSRKSDFPDFFKAPERQVESTQDATAEDVQLVQTVTPPANKDERRTWRQRLRGAKEKIAGLVEGVREKVTGRKSYEGIDFSRFRGLSGSDVHRILVQILGEPIRIRGSHHIFKGANGKTLPIPIHSGKTVSPAILVRALREWDMVEEFYERMF